MKIKIFNLTDSSGSNSSGEGEIMAGKKSEKVQILMVLPKSWSIRKIKQEPKVTNYMILTAKK
jgi:hypothetical protein